MRKLSYTILVAGLIGFISACSTSDKKETSKLEDKPTANDIAKKEFKYPIPTSFQVTALLQDADASFVLGITNPVENVDKYETRKSKALNLGVYGADLSYASTYNQQDETMKFLSVSKTLLEGLELSTVFNADMAKSIEANIDNKDSLITIVTQSFYDTYSELNKSDQSKLSLLVVCGSWIEALYITSQLAVSSNYDPRLMEVVAKQKLSAQKLAELCEVYGEEDEDIKSVLPLLRFMNIVYEGVIDGAGITEGQLGDILENVTLTRNRIVN